jgi:hypothetical protein
MRPSENIEKLIKNINIKTNAKTDKAVLGDIVEAFEQSKKPVLSEVEGKDSAITQPSIWRIIMRSRITKLAAAAVIILAVLIGLNFLGVVGRGNVTWADVTQNILDANTAMFNLRIGSGNQIPPFLVIAGKNHLRQELGGTSTIIDYESGKMLVLNTNMKTAMFIDIAGLPQAPPNFLERLQKSIAKIKNDPNAVIESLGKKEINGKEAQGIHAYSGTSVDLTIWSDPQTNLPVLVETTKLGQTLIVMSDFKFNVPVDTSLFSMEIPEGYTEQKQTKIDLSNLSEQDLVTCLKTCSELMNGRLPDKLDLDTIQQQIADFDKSVVTSMAELNQQQQRGMEIMTTIIRGLTFVQNLKGQWQYYGKDVPAEDDNSAIFWYKPAGSENYRVIYRDFNIREQVTAPAMPKSKPEESKEIKTITEKMDRTVLCLNNIAIVAYPGFMFEDGSIVIVWSSAEKRPGQEGWYVGQEGEVISFIDKSQIGLFENLKAGDALPKLPIVISALKRHNLLGVGGTTEYAGRHLAYTEKNGKIYEWSIYVPQAKEKSNPYALSFEPVMEFNPERYAEEWNKSLFKFPIGRARYIINADNFESVFMGHMAEFSDKGQTPIITLKDVLQTSEQIRSSLIK